jgi:hypothetical protein
VHNGNTRIKRFMIFAAIHGLMVLRNRRGSRIAP